MQRLSFLFPNVNSNSTTLLKSILISGSILSFSSSALADSLNTPIRITIGSSVLMGELNNTTIAQQLVQRLPMTVSFGEHPNGGGFPTKVTHLTPPLSLEGTKLGSAPGPGDIALYAPSGNLGLYYGQLQYWDGAVVLGKFSGDPELIAQQETPFTVTIELANP
ncbi:cyclophilin-like fold protein [Pokkaliibacter plantistimulans]|uniref:cyclophilin-like fold protein n=1 Tax=Pokkaliibacter plantistimulans TaxID=1635171 RepID=UPI0011B0AF41|nr:cyclophilin-like fold protein [Pokkaliibacter plantistimulans]